MPNNKTPEGKLKGTILCRRCNRTFKGHISVRYCSKECKAAAGKARPKRWRRVDPEKRAARRKRYRKENSAKGLCRHCKNKSLMGSLCEFHWQRHSKLSKTRKAKSRYGPYWEVQLLTRELKRITEMENNNDIERKEYR